MGIIGDTLWTLLSLVSIQVRLTWLVVELA